MKIRAKSNSIYLILIASIIFTSCSDAPKGDKAEVTEQKETAAVTGNTFTVDTAASYIRFTGHGVGKNHPGKFHLSSGELSVFGNQVTGGKFIINMNSLQMEQQDPAVQNKLRPHLLSEDFFDAAKYGTAAFEISTVGPYTADANNKSMVENANSTVSGNLTLKNITKNVSFPARIELSANLLKAVANFDINRTDWQITYGNDKSLGDKFISETVNVEINLQAGK